MWRNVLLSLCAVAFFISCDEDEPKRPDPTPTITAVGAPTFLLCNAESLYTYSVRVENFGVFDSVVCLVERPDGSDEIPFRLYDDGGTGGSLWPPYAANASGDIVANNGTYTRRIVGNALCGGEEGEYVFQFQAINGGQLLTGTAFVVDVRSPADCNITTEIMPTTFAACFSPTTVSVTVVEDPEVPIESVNMIWISGDTLWWMGSMNRSSGDVWEFPVDPSDFQCTPTGSNYTVRFEASNDFGLSCSRNVDGIAFENGLPVLSSPQLADTLYRPAAPGDSDTLQFFIRSDDCELVGAPWTQSVFFEVSRDDTSHWVSDAEFFLRDDGVAPDVTRGDGLASSYLVVSHSSTNLNNIYYFRFWSVECSSDEATDYLIDSTRIIQSGTLTAGNGNTLELGIASFK